MTKTVESLRIGDEVILNVPVHVRVKSISKQQGSASRGDTLIEYEVMNFSGSGTIDIGSKVSVYLIKSAL